MVKKTLLAVLVIGLSLTAGCQTHMRMLEMSGDMRVEPSTVAGADYVVHLRNTIDPNYNPDSKGNREMWALGMLKTQCPAGRIVKEAVINTGTYGIGRPSRTYSLYIRCNG
jgi:hypothetical protein